MKKIIYILIFAVLASGCSGVRALYVSKAVDLEGRCKSSATGVAKIQLRDIRIYVKPNNYFDYRSGTAWFPAMVGPYIPVYHEKNEMKTKYRKGNYLSQEEQVYDENFDNYYFAIDEGDYFYVEISIRANEDKFTFNPREIYLELEDGGRLQAAKYIKADYKLRTPFFWSWGGLYSILWSSERNKGEYKFEKDEQSLSQYFEVPKNTWIGYAIRFETLTPNPGTPFNIDIKGLKYLDDSVSVPELKFTDKKLYKYFHQ